MADTWLQILTLVAVLGTGMMAGLFFVFSAFMMTALARLPAARGMAAMQAINIAILNPAFLALFLGTALLCLGLVIGALAAGTSTLAAAGGLAYLVGAIGITAACNVPRNNALARLAPDDPDSAEPWSRYLSGWTAWNHVRTAACLLAAALIGASLLV